MRKKINIWFSGMSGKFDPENNFIINILRERYDVTLSDDPDYLFYSVNSKDYLKYNCVRIFYTVENVVPDFNICDYAIGFNDLKFGDRYIRYPLYLVDDYVAYAGDNYASDLEHALAKHLHAHEFMNSKDAFCAFVYSNAEAVICREKIFNAISEYKKINSGGRYKNNIGGPVQDKREFQTRHKFVIAFENTSTPGYTTEKIVHAFSAGAVPIYWGNPEIEKEFNGNSFINCHNYGLSEIGEDEIIQKIMREIQCIDQDDDVYIKMLEVPAFADGYNVDDKKAQFRAFLYNIFDQDTKYAFRRNRYYWGERYERKQRIGNEFYWMCRKIIPVRDKVRGMLNKMKKLRS